MNFDELKTRALSDAHREDYTDQIDGFVEQAQAHIFARLEAYGLEYTLTDVDRVETDSPIYTLPQPFTAERYILYNEMPLDKRDESAIYNLRNVSDVLVYAMRPRTVIFAGIPAADSELELHYWGLPAALVNPTDTNTLMNEYPTLYIEATQIFIYKRARDFDKVNETTTSVNNLIASINRKVKKQMGGARSSNPYNVRWRSSY
jgi:hypothetical protein